jgi:hypothetical protein
MPILTRHCFAKQTFNLIPGRKTGECCHTLLKTKSNFFV